VRAPTCEGTIVAANDLSSSTPGYREGATIRRTVAQVVARRMATGAGATLVEAYP
jgi:hypothetical protein